MPDAGFEDCVEQDLVRADIDPGTVHQREHLGHVLRVLHPFHGLHHDGYRVVVDRNTVALHQLDGLPSLPEVAVGGGDRGIHDAVVGDVVRHVPGLLHLREHVPGTAEVPGGAVALHEGVVGDDVQGTCPFHLFDERARAWHVACRDANIQHAIIRGDVQRHTRVPQLAQNLESSTDVLVSACCADQRHVVLDVQRGCPLG
mmetsp:Transcript_50540/g.156408  ORF Transcript_50540/g.156408 Transcript_50540/m.156408 type:complete len:201 (+) Transcript_50540:1456-2058(+)